MALKAKAERMCSCQPHRYTVNKSQDVLPVKSGTLSPLGGWHAIVFTNLALIKIMD